MRRDVNDFGDALRRHSADMEAEVSAARAEQIASRSMARARRPRGLPRWAAAAAGASFLVVSVAGVGVAADAAVPGDPLYRVDRAFESATDGLGLGGDRSVERLEEIIALADRGDVERAAATAVEVLEELGVASEAPPSEAFPAESTTSTSVVEPVPVPDPGSQPDPDPGATTLTAPEPDQALTIRLAAERLLRTVRGGDAGREAAVAELAVAAGVAPAVGAATTTTPPAPPPTTTSTIPGSTTTVPPAGDGTTVPDGTDGGRTDDSGTSAPTTTVPDGPGPIILPPLS